MNYNTLPCLRHIDNKFIYREKRHNRWSNKHSSSSFTWKKRKWNLINLLPRHRYTGTHTCSRTREGEKTPRWREITIVAKVYPANVYPQAADRDLWRGLGKFSLAALLQWHRPTTGAPRRHDLGELRNKVKRSSAAVARFPAQRARPPRPREKVRTAHVCNADSTSCSRDPSKLFSRIINLSIYP